MKKFLAMALCVCLIAFNFSSCCCSELGDSFGEATQNDEQGVVSGSSQNDKQGVVSGSSQKDEQGVVSGSSQKDEQEFYDLVYESKELLDIVGDDIYNNWHDCIYNDAYLDNIDYAIAVALEDNADNIEKIIENDAKIKEKYKDVKNGDCSEEAKEVMQAYNEYYSLVVEVSGSFNTYSANKETLKKNLASALKNFSFEID